MLEANLLGTPQVTVDGEPLVVDTRKAIAMLAYLVVEGSATRDQLATLLWGDSPSDRARATLRRTLSALRTGAGGSIVADRALVSLTGQLESDIARLDSGLAATAGHGHTEDEVCPDCVPLLRAATRLYRGDFLEGFSVRDAPDFEDWARNVAEAYRMRVTLALQRLAIGLAAAGDYAGAIGAVARWIELDPLHEPAHRRLMLLHAWSGDRPAAIEAYRSFATVLDTELGVPPLEETTELMEAILDEDLPPAPGAPRRVTAGITTRPAPIPTILDRRQVLDSLRDELQQMDAVQRILLLTGSAWMGKTMILDHLGGEAAAAGFRVSFGRASRGEQGLPYGIATQLLRGLRPWLDPALEGIPSWALTEIGRLLPEVGPPDPAPPADRFGELRFLEAHRELFRSLSISGPVLLAVDDLQWADPPTERLVAYLARHLTDHPVSIALTSRTGEPLDEEGAELSRTASLTIDLMPLTAADISDRVSEPEHAARVIEITGGVPLLVMEALTDPGGGAASVSRYLEAKLREIDDLERQILTTAAVLGGTADTALLRETGGRTEEEMISAIERLVAAGLLVESADPEGVRFALETLEPMLYGSTSMVRRRLLHRRAARALSERPAARSDPAAAGQVAAHYERAGAPEAAGWHRIAGDLSRAVWAYPAATGFYESALSLGDPAIGELRLGLGEIAMIEGDYRSALRHLTSAGVEAEGDLAGLVEHRLGEVERLLGRFDLAEGHFERSVGRHPRPSDVLADWALLRHRVGDHEGARDKAEQAVEAAGASEDPRQESRARNVLAVVNPDNRAALADLDEALRLAGGDDLLRMAALNNKALRLADLGAGEEAMALVEEAIEIATRTGNRHREAALWNQLADLHHRAGRSTDAEQSLTRAVSIFAGLGGESLEPEVWLLSQW